MSRFAKPDTGNTQRPGSPVNSVRNLRRKLNRQERDIPGVLARIKALITKATAQ